ncbi:MAG: hypothetical protein H6R00_1380 [Proteobacteria bacterium]|nr:hypothetical protein [Pseudomonadota bacterium]
MSNMPASPLASRLSRTARTALIIVGGTALMTLAAKIQIPFWPVPMTLHTVAVMLFAVTLGPRLSLSIFLAYLAAGAAGLPVFSGSPERGIGLAYMAGPTGGYLAGYLVATWMVGTLAAGRGIVGRLLAMLAGLVPVYALGLAWLAVYVPADKLIALGIAPFILGDIVKVALVAAGCTAVPATLARLKGPAA